MLSEVTWPNVAFFTQNHWMIKKTESANPGLSKENDARNSNIISSNHMEMMHATHDSG